MSSGTITVTNKSDKVVGVGTAFTTDLKAGDVMVMPVGTGSFTLIVKSIESATGLTLMEPFRGPTLSGQSWSAVPYETMLRINAQLSTQTGVAIYGLNLDKQNWQAVFSESGDITITLPDLTTFTGPSWKKIADLLEALDPDHLDTVAAQIHADAQQVATDKATVASDKAAATQAKTDAQTAQGLAETAASGSASSEAAAAQHAADAEADKTAAAASAAAAAASAGSIHPENLLQKANHLSEFAADADAAAARGNLKVYSKSEVDAKGSGGEYPGKVSWHPSSSKLEGGTIRGDGQKITTAKVLYPDLVQRVIDGILPSTTETTWQSQPLARAAYVYDATADTLRVPDYNGVQSGSLPIPMQAGDGGTLASGSMQKGGVPNVITETNGYSILGGMAADNDPTGVNTSPTNAFNIKRGINNNYGGTAAQTTYGSNLELNLRRGSDVYTDGLKEVRVNRFIGCFVIRVATNVANGGTVDMLQLQADLSALKAAAEATDSKIGYAKVDVPGTPALNSRTVVNNPFGNNTPVICFVEIYHATLKKWVRCDWISSGQSQASIGIFVAYSEGEGLVVKTGASAFIATTPYSPTSQEVTANYVTPSPMRIHVFSVGTDISKLKQISQIDPILIQEFKAPIKPTGLRQVWKYTATETGLAGTNITFSENVKGKRLYLIPNPNEWLISCDVPAVFPPLMATSVVNTPAGYFTVFATTDVHGYKIAFNPNGTDARLTAITGSGAGYLSAIYVDDYS